MNKILLLLILFLVSCSAGGSSNVNSQSSFEAFVVNDDCLNVCWLGINPGATSVDDAKSIMMKSNQIKRNEFFQVSNEGMQSVWMHPYKSVNYATDFKLHFSKGIVSFIQFNTLAPFTLEDFISLLGEPDKIIIRLDETIDGGDVVQYAVYFSSRRVSLSVYPGNWDGPNQQDQVSLLTLNSEFIYPGFIQEESPQSWLGYGHLQEYLANQDLPQGKYTPSETGPNSPP